jgi:L-threonylcarbamoyladenylate synthase
MLQVQEAVQILKKGGLVAFPTETVYGLGADALDPLAVARVFEAKERPTFDPLIVHVADTQNARDLCLAFPPLAERLAEAFWPGPITLVLPKRPIVPDLVTSGLPTVALRVPAHPLALELLKAFGRPLAAPSANRFGHISPTTAEHVRQSLDDRIDGILDGGPCRVGVESTVLSLLEETPILLRHGGIPLEELEKVCGKIRLLEEGVAVSSSPGRLERHYAPETRMVAIGTHIPFSAGQRWGCLAFQRAPEGLWAFQETLSPKGDSVEAAARLFASLRRLDGARLDGIAFEWAPETGLGRAINDRLKRASAPANKP